MIKRTAPATIDAYLSGLSPETHEILQKIRQIVRNAAPDAQEVISYQMPAFKLTGILLFVGAFKQHIGIYPPIKGDAKLEKAVAPYAGEKGNLRFPLARPIPYDLIERIVRLRVTQDRVKTTAKRSARA